MRCNNNNGMMAWDAIRRPHFAQLAAPPCASLGKVRPVCASLTTTMGNTRISCYSRTPAYLIAGRLCHSAALAKSQAATTHASYLELSRSEVWKGFWQSRRIGSIWPTRRWPCVHAPACQPEPAKCRPKRSHAILRPGIFLFQLSGPQ